MLEVREAETGSKMPLAFIVFPHVHINLKQFFKKCFIVLTDGDIRRTVWGFAKCDRWQFLLFKNPNLTKN